MRIAIPVWEDKVSPVLDTASRLLIVDVEDRNEARRFQIYLDEQDLSRRCLRIRGMEIGILICGAISRPFERMLAASGIRIIRDISGQSEEVLKAHLRGELLNSDFLMPGYRKSRLWKKKERDSLNFKRSRSPMGKKDGH